jgi:hypothetical protein
MGVRLPPTVGREIESYLSAADGALPGFVECLYVTGSIALGDYWPAISDVDLVAVCTESPRESQFEALSTLHRPSRPNIDVLYVTRGELTRDPRGLSPAHSIEGAFKPEGAFNANPVTWRQLSTAALPIRGPRLSGAEVWFEADALRRWNLANLENYWVDWLQWWRGVEPTDARVRNEYGLQWLVLGVPRLHYTIATLGVTSKTGAGLYALDILESGWHTVIETAMALRAEPSARLPMSVEALHRDAADLSAWLIEDARRQIDV